MDFWLLVLAIFASVTAPVSASGQLHLKLTVDASNVGLVVENQSNTEVKIGKNQFEGVPSVFSIRVKGPTGDLILRDEQSEDGWFNPAWMLSYMERFPLAGRSLAAGEQLTFEQKVVNLLLPARSRPEGGDHCLFQIRATVVYTEKMSEPETIESDWVEADCAALFPAR